MTRQSISVGTVANDGTGDTLRSAGQKINANFSEIYNFLGGTLGDSLSSQISLEDSAIVFEGSLADAYETRLTAVNPTADRIVSLPDADGTIVTDTATQTLSNKTFNSLIIDSNGTIVDPNNQKYLTLYAGSSAVNSIAILSAGTGQAPTIYPISDVDTNIGLRIAAEGTGTISLASTVNFQMMNISTTSSSFIPFRTLLKFTRSTNTSYTLVDGNGIGDYKILLNTSTATHTLTPTNFAQGTSITLAPDCCCQLIFDGTEWQLISSTRAITVNP